MDSGIIVTSLGIGGAIFAGLVIFWFFNAFVKRKLGTDQSAQVALPSQKSNWEEKRQHPRVAISWPAMLEPPHESIEVQLKDISVGGGICSLRQTVAAKGKNPNLHKDTGPGGAFVKCAGGLVKYQCAAERGDQPRNGHPVCSEPR